MASLGYLAEQFMRERDRYKRERDELLAAFFEPYDTRQHIFQAILAGDPDALPNKKYDHNE